MTLILRSMYQTSYHFSIAYVVPQDQFRPKQMNLLRSKVRF